MLFYLVVHLKLELLVEHLEQEFDTNLHFLIQLLTLTKFKNGLKLNNNKKNIGIGEETPSDIRDRIIYRC